jgi:predicted nucleic-acid-binding Zn-ribbon protein
MLYIGEVVTVCSVCKGSCGVMVTLSGSIYVTGFMANKVLKIQLKGWLTIND